MKLSRRTVTGLLGLGLLVAAISLFVSIPSAQGRRMAPRRLDRAAEWGVWKTRAGQITSLDELAAELPSFVHRGRPSAASH